MTVLALPTRGRWVWDAHDRTRAVRVSTHAEVGLLNLSIWRDDLCVGTVKLSPGEAADLVAGLTDGLARLAAGAPQPEGTRVSALEERLAAVEARVGDPAWRRAAADLTGLARGLLGSWRAPR